jgi:hypothetical protein
MGVTHVTTRISNLAQDAEPWEADFLVDPVARTLRHVHARPLK